MTINTGNPNGQDSNPRATATMIRARLEQDGLPDDARRDLETQLAVAEAQLVQDHSSKLKALRKGDEFRSPTGNTTPRTR